ncbi:MAG: hypothetical protein ACJ72O_07310 [Marmoricola sp.]
MKKLIVIGATAFATLLMVLGFAPTAFAYPETTCNVTVDAQTVDAGSKVHVHGTAETTTTDNGLGRKAAGPTVHWVATFNGETRTADENVFDTTFDIPEVTTTTKYTLHVSAVMPDATTHCERSLVITAEPTGQTLPPTGPHLPNTGGPRLILLLAGFALVVTGAVSIRMSRRERSSGRHA